MTPQELINAKNDAKIRILNSFYDVLKLGVIVYSTFKKECDRNTLFDLELEYDVLSVDTINDISGYSFIDVDGTLHTGISKVDFEKIIFTIKQYSFDNWSRLKLLESQIETCTTQLELDGIIF